jgi:hypothetical protein
MWHVVLAVFHWFQEVTGTNVGIPGHTPRWYNFLSAGLEFTAIGGLIMFYYKHNCHQHHCPRIARHTTKGGHIVCKRHHPDMGRGFKITAEHIAKEHNKKK